MQRIDWLLGVIEQKDLTNIHNAVLIPKFRKQSYRIFYKQMRRTVTFFFYYTREKIVSCKKEFMHPREHM